MQKHIIIKSLLLSRDQYLNVEKRIDKNALKIKDKQYSINLFKAWSLTAIILGIFTGQGDRGSTKLFNDCLVTNKLPEIYVFEYKYLVKICICIKTDEAHRRYINSFHTAK